MVRAAFIWACFYVGLCVLLLAALALWVGGLLWLGRLLNRTRHGHTALVYLGLVEAAPSNGGSDA